MMSKLSIEHIIKLLSLPKIGRKTAAKLINDVSYTISSDSELNDFIREYGDKYRLPAYSKSDLESAYSKAKIIVDSSEKLGIGLISYQDRRYPNLLRQIHDPPVLLSYIGNIKSLLENACVAVIGTREPTAYGLKIGVRIGEYFGSNQFNIVSGLAVGCDTAGHRGALNVGGITTAVLAHGLDKIYPKENKKLATEIVDSGGLLLSEYFVYETARANYFVERDRIQAGLSLGVVVIETDIKGGTMHTVKYCTENNRILAAVMHPPELLNEPKTKGNQLLIKNNTAIPIAEKSDMENLVGKLKFAFEAESGTQNSVVPEANVKTKKAKGSRAKKTGENPLQTRIWD